MSLARAAPVLVWLAALALAGWLVARSPFATDMTAFLPRSDEPTQQVLVEQLTNGAVSHLILVGLEGAPPEALASMSKALAADLRRRDDISAVNNGELQGFERDRAYLWNNRYLLSPDVTPERFSDAGLRAALERALTSLGSQFSLLAKRTLPADPTGEMFGLMGRLAQDATPTTRHGVWFSGTLSRALLMVETRPPGFDLDAQQRILTAISKGVEDARTAAKAEGAHVVMTGPAVFAVNARASMKGDAKRFSMIATGLVALVLILAYRNPVLVVLALLPVASGAVVGLAAVALGFGFVHGVTLGFGVTLIGEAVDYAIYLFTQTTPRNPPRETLRRIAPTLRLGLLTSVVGFSAMLLSDFPGFVQLGLFTIAGLIAALAVAAYVLPSLVPEGFQGAHAGLLGRYAARALEAGRRFKYVVPLLVIAAGAVLFVHRGALWEDQIESLNPVPLAEMKRDQALRRDIGAPDVRYMAVVSAGSEDELLTQSERAGRVLSTLVGRGLLDGFDAPHLYLPSRATQETRRAALPDIETARARLARAAEGLPFKTDLFQPFLDDLARAKSAPPLTSESLADTSLRLKVQSMMIERRGHWIGILPLRNVSDAEQIETALLVTSSVRVSLLDLKDETDRLLGRYLREALTLAGAGGLAIAVLLAVSLRSPLRASRVLAPLAVSVVLTAALFVLWQQKLTIFNLFGLLLVVAVGSNYSLFFERTTREDSETDLRILSSVVLANICTVIGFGVLGFSSIPVLHGIGSTVAVGTFLSLLFAGLIARRRSTP